MALPQGETFYPAESVDRLAAGLQELLGMVASVDARLQGLEELLEEYRPLLEMVKDRAVKAQGSWRARFAPGGAPGG